MRFILGIVVGAGITWGSAWLHDTGRVRMGPAQPFVNWDVVLSMLPR